MGIDVFAVYPDHKEFAKLMLQAILGTFTLGSLLVALFGKYLQQLIDPVRLEIEVPEESNTVIDRRLIDGTVRVVFCHHLRVRNRTPHLTITNCRIWLRAIYKLDGDGQWRQPFVFAVPRLMRWAPHEVTPRERTFSKQQVFDFGQTIESNLGFEVTIDKEQQGTFTGVMPTRNRARYVFLVAADNYTA